MEAKCITGACLCGAVRFSIEPPILFCAHCHCSICRRAHGAGYVTWIGALAGNFTLLAGESALTRYRSSEHGTRSFCRTCGSTLFFTTTQHPERIDVALANVADHPRLRPQFHAYFDSRAAWVTPDDDLPRLGGPTGIDLL